MIFGKEMRDRRQWVMEDGPRLLQEDCYDLNVAVFRVSRRSGWAFDNA